MEKSEADFSRDQYERYEMVQRQIALHLADELWDGYPMQPINSFVDRWLPDNPTDILEIGCGVGRWIADVAVRYQDAQCRGVDYSYQMLRVAWDYWKESKELTIDYTSKGYSEIISKSGHLLSNLNFGVATGEDLPFDDESQDVVMSSFLVDRVDDIQATLLEMSRVLRPGGILLLVSPLNYNQAQHWQNFYPFTKLSEALVDTGCTVLQSQQDLIVKEPLDIHGNAINWKCIGLALKKNG